MSQLMSEQLLAFLVTWRVFPTAKNEMVSDRISKSADGPRRLRSALICMNAHLAEIAPKARLEETPGRAV
jgi:hypothetical protein